MKRVQVKQGKTNLAFGVVENFVAEIFINWNVEFEPGESPRNENDLAALGVEGEILDVECAVCSDECRVHPQHAAVRRHYSICYHVQIELFTRTNTTTTINRNTRGSLIIRSFDSRKVLGFFPVHLCRRWLNLHISSQLRVGLGIRWGLDLVKMHVAVYTFGFGISNQTYDILQRVTLWPRAWT